MMRYLLVLMLFACGDASDTDETDDTDDTDVVGDDDDDVQEDTWSNFASDFFATNCTGCHSSSPTDFNTYADVSAKSENILCVISAEPDAGCNAYLTDSHPAIGADADTLARVEAWIEAGMPE